MPNPEDQRHCSLQDAAQKQNKGKQEPTKFKRTKHALNQIEMPRGDKEGRASFPIEIAVQILLLLYAVGREA